MCAQQLRTNSVSLKLSGLFDSGHVLQRAVVVVAVRVVVVIPTGYARRPDDVTIGGRFNIRGSYEFTDELGAIVGEMRQMGDMYNFKIKCFCHHSGDSGDPAAQPQKAQKVDCEFVLNAEESLEILTSLMCHFFRHGVAMKRANLDRERDTHKEMCKGLKAKLKAHKKEKQQRHCDAVIAGAWARDAARHSTALAAHATEDPSLPCSEGPAQTGNSDLRVS